MEKSLNLFFTSNGILCEISESAADESIIKWKKRFDSDMYAAIYAYGIENIEDKSAVGLYLKKLMETFLRKLTDLPELETAREKVKVELTECCQRGRFYLTTFLQAEKEYVKTK